MLNWCHAQQVFIINPITYLFVQFYETESNPSIQELCLSWKIWKILNEALKHY